MEPILFYPALIIGLGVLLTAIFLLRVMRRSRWRMIPHYNEISSRLLEAHARDLPEHDRPRLSFDHFNNLGAITYTATVTLPACAFLPSQVSAQNFSSPNTAYTTEEGFIWYHSAFLSHRKAVLKVKSYHLLRDMTHNLDVQAIHDYLDAQPHIAKKDLSYDPSGGALSWSFYIKEGLFRTLPRQSTHEEHLQLLSAHLSPLLQLLATATPAFSTEEDRWIALHKIALDEETSLYTLKKALAASDSAIDKLRPHIVSSGDMPALHVLLERDLQGTLAALSHDQLMHFVLHATQHKLYTPEFVARHFASKLSFEILALSTVPMSYRVELVRAWLKAYRNAPDLAHVHHAIQRMSAQDQDTLREALSRDSSLQGALSSIDHQAGSLSMHDP